MADDESVDQAVEQGAAALRARRMRGTPAMLVSWEHMTDAQKRVWRSYFLEELARSARLRRQYALKIACASVSAGHFELKTTTADDLGKILGRFALAAADKILE